MVRLETFTSKDIDKNYIKWINDPQVNQYLECRFTKNKVNLSNKYMFKILYSEFSLECFDYIGTASIYNIKMPHGTGEVGLMIGEKSLFHKNIGTDVVKSITEYAFNVLRLRKLTAGIYIVNKAAIKVFEKNGFILEGVLRKQWLYKNKYIDGLRFGLLKEIYNKRENRYE